MISRGKNVKKLIIDSKKKEIFLAVNGFLNDNSIREMMGLSIELVNEEPKELSYKLTVDLRDVIYIDNIEVENINTQRFLEFSKYKNLRKYREVSIILYESQIKLIKYIKAVSKVNKWLNIIIEAIPVVGMHSNMGLDKINYYNFLMDLKNKKILVELVGSANVYLGLQYINDFKELLTGINSSEFELILDCTRMNNIERCVYEQFRECCQVYCNANFKSIVLTITGEQKELRKCAVLVGDIVNWEFNYV